MKLIVLGPPGSGKGTISERLAKDFHLFHISVGDFLRKEAKQKTALGKKISNYINKGDLVPAKLAVDLAKRTVGKRKNFIFDGFPRSIDQTKLIEDLSIDLVIYLDVPEKEVIKRLSGRRIDPVTGKTYHLQYLPPPKNIMKRLVPRKDDTPKVIKERFKVYHQETEPVIKYYQKKGILSKIDGMGSPEEVYGGVKKIVKQSCF
ncbi:MAG TPA: nucleoside monophosphate kinase [Candidatus Nanoarchaeia archaeon]|nr:nucleoside monophosphate kinase [Candidatus Nanoarchaeia archaeon]